MIWLAFAKRWAAPLAIVAAFGFAYAYHKVQLNSAYNRGYAAAQGDMAAQVSEANASTAALEQRQREQSNAASAAWEITRNELESQVARARASALSRPVRLCTAAGSGQVPGTASTAGSADGQPAGSFDAVRMGDSARSARMVQLAGQCEYYRLQLRDLQRWVSEATKAQPSD